MRKVHAVLTPYSPLAFIEALAKERNDSLRAGVHRESLLRRITRWLASSGRRTADRRPAAVPKPA